MEFTQNDKTFSNWALIHSCKPKYFHQPSSVEEVIEIVKYAISNQEKVKVIGSMHSPNDIALTDDHLISLDNMCQIIALKKEKSAVKCQAGIRLHQLNTELEKAGWGVKNFGSITEQSIGGLISTGSHGTGINYGVIATDILYIQIVTGTGEIIECSPKKNQDIFKAAQCGLGVIGIVTEVALAIEPLCFIESAQYALTFSEMINDMDKLANSGGMSLATTAY